MKPAVLDEHTQYEESQGSGHRGKKTMEGAGRVLYAVQVGTTGVTSLYQGWAPGLRWWCTPVTPTLRK